MTDQWKNDDDEAQMPLGTGADPAADLDLAEPAKPRISRSTVMLAGVFLSGLALLYLLGLQNRPRPASAAQAAAQKQVDSAIAELAARAGKSGQLRSLFADTDQLVQMFHDYPGTALPDTELPFNPFEHAAPRAPDPTQVVVAVKRSNADEQEQLRKTAEAFDALKLQSIIVSKNTTAALINGRLVTPGATLGPFTVETIEPQRVLLTHGPNRFQLKLHRPGTP